MIDYEGINYNLDAIIQFQMLKQLLESLATKQIAHNKLLFGKDKNHIINYKQNNNKENIISNKKNHSSFYKKSKDIEHDNNINFFENINKFGLIKEFIESQKQLIEHKKIIDELIKRIETIEDKNGIKSNFITEIKEYKKINKGFDNKDNLIKENFIDKNENKEENKDKIVKERNNENFDIISNINKKKQLINNNEFNNNYNKEDKNEINNKDNKEFEISTSKNKGINSLNLKEENLIKTEIINYEDKFKILNERINKNKNDIEKSQKIMELYKNDISKFKAMIKEDLNSIKKEKDIIKQNENEEKYSFEIMEQKMIKIIDSKFKEFTNSKMENNVLKEIMKQKIKEENSIIYLEMENIKNKNLEIENKINDLPDKSIIKRIEEKIKLLGIEMEDYSTKKDISYLTNNLSSYENEISKLQSFRMNQKEINTKYKEEIFKIKSSFENIKKTFSSISKLFENNSISELLENLNDLSIKMVEKEEYNDFVQKINKKISELRLDVNDHNRNLDQIMPLFKKISTREDLNKLENSLTELIDKQSEDASIKFAKKKEIVKSIKSIDSKVKIFMKNLNQEREKEKNEGVILASKPVGGYKCASCEAFIGELKDSYTYLPWNKYHGEEKPYRKGSSLSRILQGLNIENTFNPFIDKIKGENEKKNRIPTNCLSIKNIKKFPPLMHVISENNIIKNQNIVETLGLGIQNEDKYFQNRINLLSLKGFKGLSHDGNFLNKSKDKSNNSFNKKNKKKKDNENNSSKLIIKSKINNIGESIENQNFYI